MNEAVFDRVARRLAASATRRQATQALAGLAVVAGLGRADAPAAGAACRNNGKPCERNRDCCSNRCQRGHCRCQRNGRRVREFEEALCCGGALFGKLCTATRLVAADCAADENCILADPVFGIPGFNVPAT